MKKIVLSIALFLCLIPSSFELKAATNDLPKGNYVLSDGRNFYGDIAEYGVAEMFLGVKDNLDDLMITSWKSASKKEGKKFNNTKAILKTVKYEGNSGYDSKTKEFYISKSNNKTGRIIFEIKNKGWYASGFALGKSFAQNIDKEMDKVLEKELKSMCKKFSIPASECDTDKFDESDDNEDLPPSLDIFVSEMETKLLDLQYHFENSLRNLFVDVSGYSNTNGSQLTAYVFDQKNPSANLIGQAVLADTREYSRIKTNGFIKLPINETTSYGKDNKTIYLVFEFQDTRASNGDTIRFKINDIRHFGTLKATDIWPVYAIN